MTSPVEYIAFCERLMLCKKILKLVSIVSEWQTIAEISFATPASVYSPFFLSYYRPQTKFAKVMFLHVSCHSVHRVRSTWQVNPPAGTPPRTRYNPPDQVHPPGPGTPPEQVAPREQVHPRELGDTGNKRAVRILLECILAGSDI